MSELRKYNYGDEDDIWKGILYVTEFFIRSTFHTSKKIFRSNNIHMRYDITNYEYSIYAIYKPKKTGSNR